MHIVSEQSEQDIERKRAYDGLVPELRELAANMLRVVRGAGRPVYLLHQMESCAAAIRQYADAHGGVLPSQQVFHQILDCDAAQLEHRPWIKDRSEEDQRRWDADGTTDRVEAVRHIRDASLQIVASMLVDQMTQQNKGESDLYQGVKELNEARKMNRQALGRKSN